MTMFVMSSEQSMRQRQAAEKWLREMIAELERDGWTFNAERGCWQKGGSEVWID